MRSSGVLALVYGRPDNYIRFSLDVRPPPSCQRDSALRVEITSDIVLPELLYFTRFLQREAGGVQQSNSGIECLICLGVELVRVLQ